MIAPSPSPLVRPVAKRIVTGSAAIARAASNEELTRGYLSQVRQVPKFNTFAVVAV
jgi:hypothetical protein